MKLVKDKGFYINILSIAIPIALQNLLSFATNTADSLMLGYADNSGVLLSAANLANQTFLILTQFIFGITAGGMVLSSQYWGKSDLNAVHSVISIVLRLTVIIGTLMTAVCLIMPENIMKIFTSDPATIESGAMYLRIVSLTYIPFAISWSFIFSLRSVEIVKISAVTNVVTFLSNVFFNWVLIFGNLGFKAYGIRGAAIATLISRVLELLVIIVFVFFIDKKLKFRLKNVISFNRVLFKDLVRYGAPVVINEVMWGLGMTAQAAILGHITYSAGNPVAANSIASIVQQLATVFIFGIANSAAVLIGKSIGEEDYERTLLQEKTYRLIALIVGLLSCGLILLIKDFVVDIYNFEVPTMELAKELLIVIAINVFFVSFAAIYIVGVLRGAGDTKFCLAIEIIALWFCAIPFAFVGAFVFKLPVVFVLLLMRFDEMLKTVLCLIRVRKPTWIKSVTREQIASE